MYNGQQLIDAIKHLAIREDDAPLGLSQQQRVEFHAKQLGFNHFHHCVEALGRNTAPTDAATRRFLERLSTKLARAVCAIREADRKNNPYCEFVASPDGDLTFYSSWIGWAENGEEVRVPRRLEGVRSVPRLRQVHPLPVYVIESDAEFEAWRQEWHGTAYMSEDFARAKLPGCFDRQPLIAASRPPTELIREKYAARRWELDRNIAR